MIRGNSGHSLSGGNSEGTSGSPGRGHGAFTRRLLEHIETPGLSIVNLFIRVGNQVEEDTARYGRQRPYVNVALRTEDACLVPAQRG